MLGTAAGIKVQACPPPPGYGPPASAINRGSVFCGGAGGYVWRAAAGVSAFLGG